MNETEQAELFDALNDAMGGNGWRLIKNRTPGEVVRYMKRLIDTKQVRIDQLEKAVQVLAGGKV